MELRVLGCCGGWPEPGRACSGYLVEAGATRLWLDAGAGTLAQLLRLVRLDDVDALYLSHLDPDHSSDVGVLRNAIAYGGARRMRAMGPPGWLDWLTAAVPTPAAEREAFAAEEITPGRRVSVGALTLLPLPVNHGDKPTFGCRLEAEGVVLAFSADSAPCDALIELARDADLFLCESHLSRPHDTPTAESTVMHPVQAGAIASAAGARRLLLTHLHPGSDPAAAVATAATAFTGPIEAATQGATYDVG